MKALLMTDISHIASLVVQARPEGLDLTVDRLLGIVGIEVHAKGDNGKIVVVMEVPDTPSLNDRIRTIEAIPDVINAVLIYHQVDEPDHEFQPINNEEKQLPC